MQIGAVELRPAQETKAFHAWADRVKRYFDTHRGGCSISASQPDASTLFFNLPNGREALGAFVAHVKAVEGAGEPHFFLQDEHGELQAVEY